MIVTITHEYEGWKPGDEPDLLPDYAARLVAAGVAIIPEDQTRRDYTPKAKEAEPEPQKIEVHNYFLAPEDDEAPAPKKISKRKKA
jgi:hypothetical protein